MNCLKCVIITLMNEKKTQYYKVLYTKLQRTCRIEKTKASVLTKQIYLLFLLVNPWQQVMIHASETSWKGLAINKILLPQNSLEASIRLTSYKLKGCIFAPKFECLHFNHQDMNSICANFQKAVFNIGTF